MSTITQLIITTPLNPAYSGTTFGVKFEEGQALLTERAKPNRYGHTLESLAGLFRATPGYQVEAIRAVQPAGTDGLNTQVTAEPSPADNPAKPNRRAKGKVSND
jgi:hypothetical protein